MAIETNPDSHSPTTTDLSHKRVLTGMRTTGALHLGHYVGALKEWKRIQDEGQHESFFLLADVQALTTHADHPELLSESVRDVVLDWMSVGLDPKLERTHFVLQSQIPERYEISALLMMIAKYSEVMRNPTLKAELKSQPNATMGFMAYPVDQAADILMVSPYPPTEESRVLVPVGQDQVAHLEATNVLARRFNGAYEEVFTECEPLVGEVGRLVGVDGTEKMSKSKDNAIYLTDDAKTVERKVMQMFTDPKHLRATDPGDTENNPVFIYLRAFDQDTAEVSDLTERYRSAGVKLGDVEVKRVLVRVLNEFLDPIRQRRAELEETDITPILEEGTRAARAAAKPVVEAMRRSMHLTYPGSK